MFFQVDDQFQVNAKAMALANRALTGDLDGLAALGLWTLAGSRCQAQLTDGVVSLADIVRTTLNPVEGPRLAGILVEVGLWHAPGHSCPRCPEVEEGTWLFHDWFQFKYDPADQARLKRDKRKELGNKRIRNEVWRRDRIGPPAEGHSEEADCRYCGRRLRRADRKGDGRAEIDHVDPSLVIGVDNLVICCQECNTKKGDRSLEDAGMRLRPAPASSSRDVGGPLGPAAAAGGEPGAGVLSASGVPSRGDESAHAAGRASASGPQASSSRDVGGPLGPAAAAGGEPGAGVLSASGVPSRGDESAHAAGRASTSRPLVSDPGLGEGAPSGSPAAAVAGPDATSPGPEARGAGAGSGSGSESPGVGSRVGSEARDSDSSLDPGAAVTPRFACDDKEKSPPSALASDLTGRSERADQRQNQNAHPVPARTRAGGVGWGGAGKGKGEAGPGRGQGQGEAGPGRDQGRAGPGTTTPARHRRRKRKRSRGDSPPMTCLEHGDRHPCRLCEHLTMTTEMTGDPR